MTPPPVPTLTIACPPAAQADSTDGSPVAVTYAAATSSGGVAPVTTTCVPPSGALFNTGTTSVTCSATDSRGAAATCSFQVTVIPPPQLIATRFVAFGDSLTSGTLAVTPTMLLTTSQFDYPRMLLSKLQARYRLQTLQIVNEGIPGEMAADGGVQRFRSVMLQHRPGIVLLMEGTNDLLNTVNGPTYAITALRQMVQEAKSQGIRVALATIPPQRAGGLRHRDAVAAIIPGFNDQVRALATSEAVALVDVYNAMKDDMSLIGLDDLHPTPRGYEVIAETFFQAIRRSFEQTPAMLTGAWR
jgi:lysophospholipase L1-like esterase